MYSEEEVARMVEEVKQEEIEEAAKKVSLPNRTLCIACSDSCPV